MPRVHGDASSHVIPVRNILILVLLVNVLAWWGTKKANESIVRSSDSATGEDQAQAGTRFPEVVFASLDGQFTFRVPTPADPEYDDYLEMLAHPKVRSSLQDSPGFAMPYDPEWRSMITGRREVPRRDYELTGGSESLEDLGHAILAGLQEADSGSLYAQRISEDEFGNLLWPEFPQSRPYLKIPLWEAWGFNHAKGVSGIRAALQMYGHRKLQLVDIQHTGTREFCNFRLLQDVRIVARNLDNNETEELQILPAVVQCRGKFKALNYSG